MPFFSKNVFQNVGFVKDSVSVKMTPKSFTFVHQLRCSRMSDLQGNKQIKKKI